MHNIENPGQMGGRGFGVLNDFHAREKIYHAHNIFDWDSFHARLETTTRHEVVRKRSTKRLTLTGNLFRKNLQVKRCLLIQDLKPLRS